MLCKKNFRTSSIGKGKNTIAPRRGGSSILDTFKIQDKLTGVLPSLRPKTPSRWGLPTEMRNVDIVSQSINFSQGLIEYNIQYDSPKITGVNTDDGTGAGGCPPLDVMPGAISLDYPEVVADRVNKKISISCEVEPDLFGAFLSGGIGGFAAITAPTSYTGKYAEDYFRKYIINGETPTELPEDLDVCYKSIDLCTYNADGGNAVSASTQVPARIWAVTITDDLMKINAVINGKPVAYIQERENDEIPLDPNNIKPIHFPVFHPDLKEDLDRITTIAGEVVKTKPSDIASGPVDNDTSEITKCCKLEENIELSMITSFISFNYSFFTERMLDSLFIRIWLIFELFLFMFWNIIPICSEEWDEIGRMIRRVFAFDPFQPDDKQCVPEFIENIIKDFVEWGKEVTRCDACLEVDKDKTEGSWGAKLWEATKNLTTRLVKGWLWSLLDDWKAFRGCIIYIVICFLRKLRNYICRLMMVFGTFVLNMIVYTPDVVCDLFKGNLNVQQLFDKITNQSGIILQLTEDEQTKKQQKTAEAQANKFGELGADGTPVAKPEVESYTGTPIQK